MVIIKENLYFVIGTKKSSIGICGCRLAVDCGRVGKNTSDRITGKLSASFLRPHSESLEKAKRVEAIQVISAVMVSECISNPVNFFTLQLIEVSNDSPLLA